MSVTSWAVRAVVGKNLISHLLPNAAHSGPRWALIAEIGKIGKISQLSFAKLTCNNFNGYGLFPVGFLWASGGHLVGIWWASGGLWWTLVGF